MTKEAFEEHPAPKYTPAELKKLAASSRRYIDEKPRAISWAPCVAVHNQLRDLIISPAEDRIAFVHSKSVFGVDFLQSNPSARRLFDLPFNANCLVQGNGLLIAAGQKKEIAVRAFSEELASSNNSGWSAAQFQIGSQINNSVAVATRPGESAETPATARLYVSNNDMSLSIWDVHPPVAARSRLEIESGWFSPEEIAANESRTKVMLERKGSLTLRMPVNFSAVSPDGKLLVAVGDTQEVYFFKVPSAGDGRYTLIHTANAANDCCFSADWSRDCQKCAIASQDGVVALFDVRQLKTNTTTTPHTQLTQKVAAFKTSTKPYQNRARALVGAARCVKFSPGISTELLAFTEQTNHVNIVDARTYDPETIQRIRLPAMLSSPTDLDWLDHATFNLGRSADSRSQYERISADVQANIFSRMAAGQATRARVNLGAMPGLTAAADFDNLERANPVVTGPTSRASYAAPLSDARFNSNNTVQTLNEFFHSDSVPESFNSLTNDTRPASYDRDVEVCGLAWSPSGRHLYVGTETACVAYNV